MRAAEWKRRIAEFDSFVEKQQALEDYIAVTVSSLSMAGEEPAMEAGNRKRKAEGITPNATKDDQKDETNTKEDSSKRAKALSEATEQSKESDVAVEESSAAAGEETAESSAETGASSKEPESESKKPTEAAKTEESKGDDEESKEEVKVECSAETKETKAVKGPIFGATAGFSGFASVKSTSGFGFGTSSATGASFGSAGGGFGSSNSGNNSAIGSLSSQSGFGSSVLRFGTAKGFGEPKPAPAFAFGAPTMAAKGTEGEAETETGDETAPIDPVVELPSDYEIKSGEEDEVVLWEARARTHKLIPAGSKIEAKPTNVTAKAAVHSVPPSQSLVGASQTDETEKPPETSWQEVGTGPLKVLQHVIDRKIRLVQRREVSPSGPATKVLVNAPLHIGGLAKTNVQRPTEKHVQWTTHVEGKAVTYLFKFKTAQEASKMAEAIEDSQKPAEDAV